MAKESSNAGILNIYQSVVEINPTKDSIIVHKESCYFEGCNLDTSSASGFISTMVNNYISDLYREQIGNFLELDSMIETYKLKKYAEIEVKTVDNNWCRVTVFPGETDGAIPVSLYICSQNITHIKASVEKHNEMVSAMSHIFDAIFFVDLNTELVGVVNTNKSFYKPKSRVTPSDTFFKSLCDKYVHKDYMEEMIGFFSLDTLKRRLANKDVVSNEFMGADGKWYWGQFICAARNGGYCSAALLGIRDVSIEKKRNENKDNIIRSLTSHYKNIFTVSFSTGMVDIFRIDMTSSEKYKEVMKMDHYNDIAKYYVENIVYEEDRLVFADYQNTDTLKRILQNRINSKVVYRVKQDTGIHYLEARFEVHEEDDDYFILAIKSVDDEVALRNEVKRGYDAYVTLHKLIKSGMWSQFFDDEEKPSKMVWSDEFRRMLGYQNSEEFPDNTEKFFSMIDSEDKERVVTAIKNAVYDHSGNTLFDEVFKINTLNRGIRWFRATGDCSRNANGSPFCFYGVFLDVTDEHERENLEKERIAALDEANAYQEAMNAIHGAMNSARWSINFTFEGNYESVKWGGVATMLGYSEEEFPDTTDALLNLVHPDDYDIANRFLIDSFSATEDNLVNKCEFRILNKKKEYYWFQSVGNVVLGENGKPRKMYGLLLDVNEKKKYEERLGKQYRIVEALSRDYSEIHLVDMSNDKVTFVKRSGEMQDIFSTQTRKYSDLWNETVGTYAFVEDSYEILDAICTERVLKELAHKDEYSYNFRLNNNGEHYYQIKYIKLGTIDSDSYIVSGLRSIDDIIASEKEQKILLKNALASAERANRAKTVFLNSMSHDIRTPMNAIVGFANLASTHIENKNQVKDYLEKIKVSSNHLLSLINDVLDMSRIESGKVKIDAKALHLPDALHEIRSIIQSDITAKRLELQIDCVDVVNEDIICDKLRLNQVLLNLVSNSIKFTPAGGTISIMVVQKTCVVTGKANFEFIVKDTGIGMSSEFVEHIFEPFSREETSTVSGIQGTGLGMAITKNIVDMMHGTIKVNSKPGEGSEFIIALSFDVEEKAVSTEPIEEYVGMRALIADDDMDACFSVSKMLTSLGLRAEWTTSGKEAVARTNFAISDNDQYGLYIFDWLIPDMNGLEIVRRIRKDISEDAKIIILSSYDWTDIEAEAKEAGVTAFCSKPLFLSELREILTGSVKKSKTSDDDDDLMSFEGRRILVVEDNELNREIAVGILETVGFITETAEDGTVAVDMISKSKPGYYDVVLMDIQMPIMNGYEATKKIRELDNEVIRNIPIIAMTANAFEEDKKKALSVGMNSHVAKPFEAKELFKTIRSFLKNQE